MKSHIPLAAPHMSQEGYELDFIHDAFEKNWITSLGENVTEFENAVRNYLGCGYPVALASGTAALHLSLILAGVERGDMVFCQDLTFAASANPIVYVGAEPVFIDSERDTWNMDPAALEKAISQYGIPKAVVLVHLYGNPAKLELIGEICRKYHIALIEDAAEALGSIYQGRKCGTWGDFSIFSFNGNKIITTSGGGMLVCCRKKDTVRALKLATQAKEPVPWYQHQEIGYNYRMSNISAGIGRGQMNVLPRRIEQKRTIFQWYQDWLGLLPLTMQPETGGGLSNRWLSAILTDPGSPVTPSGVLAALECENIEGRYLWKPMHLQPVFRQMKYVALDSSVSEDLFSRGVCLPSDTRMTPADVNRVCKVISGLF